MFSVRKKLDSSLKSAIDNDRFKSYRVIIHCSALVDGVEHKIKQGKDNFICKIEEANCICANLSAQSILKIIEKPEISLITFDDFAYLCSSNVVSKNKVSLKLGESFKYTGKGVCVGIVDSGTFPHPDLMTRTKGIVKFSDIVSGLKYPYDDNGDGTFVSGIIRGNGSNSKGMYRGVAPSSGIYSIKAFNSLGKAYISNVFLAIDTLINESKEFNIKVICLPFEISTEDNFILSTFNKLFEKAISSGIVVVVPSGTNENTRSSIRGFAALDTCITVGGLNTEGQIKSYTYSSSGPCGKLTKPDLSAPCVSICSLNSDTNYISERNGSKLYPNKLNNYYTTCTGTSCAAAYVSGICALLFEKDNSLTFKDILSLLNASCTLLNFPKWQQGEGFLDVAKLFSS
jgi:subtilisin family serine protease